MLPYGDACKQAAKYEHTPNPLWGSGSLGSPSAGETRLHPPSCDSCSFSTVPFPLTRIFCEPSSWDPLAMTHRAIGPVSNTTALRNTCCVGGKPLGGLSSVPAFSFLCSGRICFSATFPSKHIPVRRCLLHRFLNDEMIWVWLRSHNETKNSKMKKQYCEHHTYKKQLYTWVISRDQKKKMLKLIFSNLSLTARAKTTCFEGLALCYY